MSRQRHPQPVSYTHLDVNKRQVLAGRLWGLLLPNVRVALPGGELSIHWAGEGESVTLTGPATTVFEGGIEL